jgi:cytochrome oxidase Cu insertion factor (SCO1/SenC/PrrC family)
MSLFRGTLNSVVVTLSVLGALALGLVLTPARGEAADQAALSNNGGSIWGASYFPDVELTSHQGKQLRFFSDLIKDKVVVINFIYTTCPDECALETARLREVQKILGDRVGKDVFIYSITIDPAHDTPKLLKEYAEKFEVGPGWLFLTGKEADITQLRVKLGLYSVQEKDNKLGDHNLSLIIGNQKTGRWMRVSPSENPYFLANELGNWLHNWKMPPNVQRDYADAPKVRNISAGETLYRTRCSACHQIGAEAAAGSPDQRHPIGPDLLNIAKKRDQHWLTRWLMEPDKVLAEKDPIALDLLARYNNLPMPNMRLANKDAQALLDYIDEESRRVEHQHQHGHDHGHDHGAGHDSHTLHEVGGEQHH